jgi:hypothetical protein
VPTTPLSLPTTTYTPPGSISTMPVQPSEYTTPVVQDSTTTTTPTAGTNTKIPNVTTKTTATTSSGHALLPGQSIFSAGITGLNPPLMAHPGYLFENCSSCHYPGATGALHLVEADHSCAECHWMNPRLPWFHPLADDYSCMICHLEVKT